MEYNYVYLLDCCCAVLRIIKLSDDEKNAAEQYEDFEDFLATLEKKYDFRLCDCDWMATQNLEIIRYE